jgi:hexosaminidase
MRALFLFLFPLPLFAGPLPVHIIPEPAQLSQREGVFSFNKSTTVLVTGNDSAFNKITKDFFNEFYAASGIKLKYADAKNNIVEIKQSKNILAEGYIIDIYPGRVTITSKDAAGLFYAFKSMRQLLPEAFFSKAKKAGTAWNIPCVSITDYPRFSYRGMHLDVSRHFFDISFLKKYLDILSFYKINTFHWHLTDSHGWRLEIKKYPKLTSIGAWRASRNVPMTISPPTGKDELADYGGFYTQDQVKELIQYARHRYITIIPEIEMPGHCDAAVAAYPEYTCLNNPVPLLRPTGYQGDLQHNFCPGNDSTFIFLQDVLDEVMALFPSNYIHIGGDEVKPASWLSCPRCQKRMKDENLSNAKQLQSYFTHRIDQYVTSRHKRVIGWDEIMEAGISQNAAVMSWRGNEGGIAAAKAGHSVVMTPYQYVYFDYYQSAPELEPNINYAALTLEKVYAFDPLPIELNKKEQPNILGGQACLWTENVPTPDRVEYMLLPRMLALAECIWSPPANKNYRKFIDKCEEHFKMLEDQGTNYAKSLYNISIQPRFDAGQHQITVDLLNQTAGKYIIRYNLSGALPLANSPIYAGTVVISGSNDFSAALFDKDKMLGKISKDHFSLHQALGAKVTMNPASRDTAEAASISKLTDGIHGTFEPYDGRWVGFDDSLFSLTINLNELKTIHSINFNCLEDMIGNNLVPANVNISISADGGNYRQVYKIENKIIPLEKLRHVISYKTNDINQQAKFIRMDFVITRTKYTVEPSPNSLLIDELVIE